MRITRLALTVTTDASGDGSATSTMLFEGILLKLYYVPDVTNPLATGADLTITDDLGQTIYSQTNIGTSAYDRLPRRLISNIDGVESTTVHDYIPVSGKITATIAQGGDTDTGTFYLYVGYN